MTSAELLHYFSVALPLFLSSIGVGIGQGYASFGALQAIIRQKEGKEQIFRAMIVGLALIESAAVIALVITMMSLFGKGFEITWPVAIAELGIGLSVGISTLVVGISSSFAVKNACLSIARHPFVSQKVITLMLLTQSLIEAAVVFAFIIALFIRARLGECNDIYTGVQLLSAGLAMGLGCVGPAIGQAVFSGEACKAVGLNIDAYSKILPYSLISEAAITTPMVFSLLISFLILFSPMSSESPVLVTVGFFLAGITMGSGGIGSASAAGIVSAKGVIQVARNPNNYSSLLRATVVAQSFVGSTLVYAFIVAMFLIVRGS